MISCCWTRAISLELRCVGAGVAAAGAEVVVVVVVVVAAGAGAAGALSGGGVKSPEGWFEGTGLGGGVVWLPSVASWAERMAGAAATKSVRERTARFMKKALGWTLNAIMSLVSLD